VLTQIVKSDYPTKARKSRVFANPRTASNTLPESPFQSGAMIGNACIEIDDPAGKSSAFVRANGVGPMSARTGRHYTVANCSAPLQTTLPPTIVFVARPFMVQPSKGLFLDLLAESCRR
jgi:hypothetical protein